MIVRTALASALALGALTSAALAEEPAKAPLTLTDAQMDGVVAGLVTQANIALVLGAIVTGAPQVGGNAVSIDSSISQSNELDASVSN